MTRYGILGQPWSNADFLPYRVELQIIVSSIVEGIEPIVGYGIDRTLRQMDCFMGYHHEYISPPILLVGLREILSFDSSAVGQSKMTSICEKCWLRRRYLG